MATNPMQLGAMSQKRPQSQNLGTEELAAVVEERRWRNGVGSASAEGGEKVEEPDPGGSTNERRRHKAS